MIIAERAARLAATKLADACAEAANAQADLTSTEALIAQLKLAIEKLRRELYGSRSERKARLLDQMELELEEIEAAAREDELAARQVSTEAVAAFERKRPSRRPFPAHLPRERVVIAAPQTCPCCGSTKLSKLGEDITETLEVIPRQWKVVQTVRERFSCRDCETITQPPAPFHVTPRGFADPTSWPPSCSRSSGSISRSTGRASAMPARASSSASRRSPTKSAPARRLCDLSMS